MTSANRATRIGKLHTLLKKAYKPTLVSENRPLMEHLLYACLLENAPYELADEALARLEQDYFDWNEVRVTTVTELAEVLNRLPDPTAAALRLKKNLHGLFESTYTFDLEELRKQNLGKALQKFEKLPAMTPFVLSYLTQHGLGGHAIPLDSAALRYFWLSDIINENELKTGKVTGLERAIPKSKGLEFASLLHQAAVALNIDPNDETAREIVLTLNPELDQKVADHVAAVKQRRVAKAIAAAEADADAQAAKVKPATSGKKASKASDKSAAKSSGKSASKSAAKGEAKPAKAASPKEPQGDAGDKSADSKANGSKKETAPKSSKTKGASKAAPAGSSSGKAGATADASGDKSSKGKKSEGGSKKSVKKAATTGPEEKTTQNNDVADAPAGGNSSTAAKASGKKISKRKPR